MKDWFANFLHDEGGDIYDHMQMLRPDYKKAMNTLARQIERTSRTKPDILRVLDVACGTAIALRQLTKNSCITDGRRLRLVGLDHDRALLRVAKRLCPPMFPRRGDMVTTSFRERFDLILCSFAYHHAQDSEKRQLCTNLRKWAAPDADLLVLEICLTRAQVVTYYQYLKHNLPASPHRDLCSRFLTWTMAADRAETGEWKVQFNRMMADYVAAGWSHERTIPIWTPPSLGGRAGCFLIHFRPESESS